MPRSHDNSLDHDHEQEHSFDLVARVRAAREAAESEMRKFGKVSEYEVRKVYGQRADLNYDDESVPGLPDPQVHQQPDHHPRITPSEEKNPAQGTLDFEAQNSRHSRSSEEV
jgi:hypothetical protein